VVTVLAAPAGKLGECLAAGLAAAITPDARDAADVKAGDIK
jgi:hypothetical protein